MYQLGPLESERLETRRTARFFFSTLNTACIHLDEHITNQPTNTFFQSCFSFNLLHPSTKNISSESMRGRDAGRICSTTPLGGALSNKVLTFFLLLSFLDPPSLLVCLVEKAESINSYVSEVFIQLNLAPTMLLRHFMGKKSCYLANASQTHSR